MAATWAYVYVGALATLVVRSAATSTLPICYPPGTFDFVRGLGLNELPYGVRESCDENDVIAYEVDESAAIASGFRRVLTNGYVKRQPTDRYQLRKWPGDFSVSMRVRLWEDTADIITIFDWFGQKTFSISVGEFGVFLKFNGMVPAVQVSNTKISDWKFHRILLSFRGNRVLSRVSSDHHDGNCGIETTTELSVGTEDRTIAIDSSLVLLGREGASAIEPPHATIQQLVFMPGSLSAYECRYEIPCSTLPPSQGLSEPATPTVGSGIKLLSEQPHGVLGSKELKDGEEERPSQSYTDKPRRTETNNSS